MSLSVAAWFEARLPSCPGTQQLAEGDATSEFSLHAAAPCARILPAVFTDEAEYAPVAIWDDDDQDDDGDDLESPPVPGFDSDDAPDIRTHGVVCPPTTSTMKRIELAFAVGSMAEHRRTTERPPRS
jgi:hypothetical protein